VPGACQLMSSRSILYTCTDISYRLQLGVFCLDMILGE